MVRRLRCAWRVLRGKPVIYRVAMDVYRAEEISGLTDGVFVADCVFGEFLLPEDGRTVTMDDASWNEYVRVYGELP